MRVLFCGSGAFATPALAAIRSAGHDVAGVVTQPPRAAGRGGHPRATPLAEAGRAAGLEVLETPDINAPAAVEWIRSKNPDVICVADFGQMVRAAVRETARIDAFNIHGSLLPALRGAAPVNWAIIRGLAATGVTTFSLIDRLDAGAVYVQLETPIAPQETAAELKERLAQLGADAACRTLDMLAGGKVAGRPQDESRATKAPVLQKSDGIIDWSAEAVAIRNLIHGTWPWPAGQTVFLRQGGQEDHVILARAVAEECVPGGEAGTVDQDLCVRAGRGRLRIVEIKPAGKRLMSWRDFVNGHRVAAGDKFVKPSPDNG